MKPDEKEFLKAVLALEGERDERGHRLRLPMDIIPFGTMHPKRSYYLLKKWSDKEWLEYGVSLRTGWLTEAGIKAAKDIQ